MQKCPLNYNEILRSSQSSPNIIKLAEFKGMVIGNLHVKFEYIQKSSIFSCKNADSSCPSNYYEVFSFSQSSPNSSNLQNLLILASDTCIWNMSPFREVKKFMQNADSAGPSNYYIFTSSQSSPNYIKLPEFTDISIWNLHLKFEPIQRS